MTANFSLPLSGDVTQAWQFWLKSLSQQTGFININQTVSSDPELEKKITGEVAGYGKQLGILIDLVALLACELDGKDLDAEQSQSIKKFKDLEQSIRRVKWEHGQTGLSADLVDKLMDDLHTMKKADPEAYDTILARLQKGLAKETGR